MKFLVKFDLEFDLKFEISDGKNLVKFGGRTFLPARKAREISETISGQIPEQISGRVSETSFQISRFFFGNFVQQKGGANEMTRGFWCLVSAVDFWWISSGHFVIPE